MWHSSPSFMYVWALEINHVIFSRLSDFCLGSGSNGYSNVHTSDFSKTLVIITSVKFFFLLICPGPYPPTLLHPQEKYNNSGQPLPLIMLFRSWLIPIVEVDV